MRFDLDRTTLVLVVFIVIIAAIFGINQFVISQPPIEITVVTSPLAEDWVMAAAQDYNAGNNIVGGTARVQVNVQVNDDLEIWRGNIAWNSQNHPDAWIPSSSISLEYAPSSLMFETSNTSLARTPLVWGGFQSRVDTITQDSTLPFEWTSVQAVASETSWLDGGFVNMAINWPSSSMSGIGALMTASASYANTATIDRSHVTDSDFTAWFAPLRDTLLNAERIGGNPADAMASRGSSVADFALLPESQWLTALDSLTNNQDVAFAYPDYQFPLDFPFAAWDDSQTTDNERAAIQSFAAFLAGDGQAIAIEHGLRPANSEPDENASLFTAAEAFGILLIPDYGEMLTTPNRSTVDAIINLVD